MSSLAYFLAKDMIDHINTIVRPAVYLSMFYFFNNPRSSILDNYLILLCVVYCVTGIAYALAIYFEPGQAQLWSVLLPVVLTLVASKDSVFTAIVGDYIYSKWALEAFIIANAKRYSGVWLITRCGVLRKKGYTLDHWYPCLLKLILLGAASRCVAFLLLITFQKK
ncbi:ABC transporter G family member 28 [Capsicum annuum]